MQGSDGGVQGYGSDRHPSDGVVQSMTSPVSRSPRYMMPSPPIPAPPPDLVQAHVTLPPLRLALDENQLPTKVPSTTTSPASHALPLAPAAQTYQQPPQPPQLNDLYDKYGYTQPMGGYDVGNGARYGRPA
jgi:hypothetical protein